MRPFTFYIYYIIIITYNIMLYSRGDVETAALVVQRCVRQTRVVPVEGH